MFRFHDFSIEVCLVHGPKEDLNSKIAEFPCELDLIIPKSALGAIESDDHYIPEEGDLGEQDIGLACFHAIGTFTIGSHC